MSLTRQGRHYLLIGGLQWLVDWGVMVALSHLGLRIGVANVAGRVSGALLGFWLNGRITFAGDEHTIGRR
jgi:putative flippase GtrA